MGFLVRDAQPFGSGVPVSILEGATLNAAGTTNGTARNVSKPGPVRFVLSTGATVGGTSPTLDVEVQGADDAGFTQGVVSYGRFAQISGTNANQQNLVRELDARVYKRFVRARVTLGGTSPTYSNATLRVVAEHDRRDAATDTA